jgi:hypothetical protein
MRFLLRIIVFILLLFSFLLFGSLHWEEGENAAGLKTRSFCIGLSQSPWLEYEKSYTHENQLDALLSLADELAESGKEVEEDGTASKTADLHYQSSSHWKVNYLSWSSAFGLAFLVLLFFYWKLRAPRSGRAR